MNLGFLTDAFTVVNVEIYRSEKTSLLPIILTIKAGLLRSIQVSLIAVTAYNGLIMAAISRCYFIFKFDPFRLDSFPVGPACRVSSTTAEKWAQTARDTTTDLIRDGNALISGTRRRGKGQLRLPA